MAKWSKEIRAIWSVFYKTLISLQIEKKRGRKDDTSLNNVALLCKSRAGNPAFTEITSPPDPADTWGDWEELHECETGTFLTGYRLQVRKYRVNLLYIMCSHTVQSIRTLSLFPKSPSVRGFVASFPVRLHITQCILSGLVIAAMRHINWVDEPGKTHCVIWI